MWWHKARRSEKVGIKNRENKMGGVASGAAVVCVARYNCKSKRVDGAVTGGWGIRGTRVVSSEGNLPSLRPHIGGSKVQSTEWIVREMSGGRPARGPGQVHGQNGRGDEALISRCLRRVCRANRSAWAKEQSCTHWLPGVKVRPPRGCTQSHKEAQQQYIAAQRREMTRVLRIDAGMEG